MEPSDKTEFFADFEKLFDNPENSDLTIVVPASDVQFYAHQLIIGLRTDFFNAALRSDFKEASTRVVEINEHSSHAVLRFLKYCYTGNYPSAAEEEKLCEDDDPPKLKHLYVYALADMLGCESLKKLAISKLNFELTENWSSKKFPAIVDRIYSTTASGQDKLRNLVVKQALMNFDTLKSTDEFKAVCSTYAEFSWDMLLAQSSSISRLKEEFERNRTYY